METEKLLDEKTLSHQENTMLGEMVQIVKFDLDHRTKTVTPHIDSDKMIKILNDRRANSNVPFVVVSTIGTKRSGKSFLTNALIHFLKYLEKNRNAESNGWMEESVEIKMSGVEWRNGRQSVTRGIWMWNQPIILALERDQKIGVLVMDCQGLHDFQLQSEAVDSLLTLMALSLSKIHIINMVGDTCSYDIENLANSVRYYQQAQLQKTINEIFNTLVLLHRDWTGDSELGEREITLDEVSPGLDEEENMSATLGAFKKVIEFMLPRPGQKIEVGSVEDHLLLSDMLSEPQSKKFFEYISNLFVRLLVELPLKRNEPSVLTSRKELTRTVKKLRDDYGNGEIMFPVGSREVVFERTAILRVKDEVELKIAEVGAKIIIRDFKSKENLLSSLSVRKLEIDNFLNQRKEQIRAASQVECTPANMASTEELWRLVESKADILFSSLQKRKIKEYTNKKALGVAQVVVPVVTLTTIGVATGGIVAVAIGGPILIATLGGAALGLTVGGATSTITKKILSTKKEGVEDEIEREKREVKKKK